MASFLNFLPEKKGVIIRKLACGESVNLQAITDVLNEHRLYDLCCSAARMTLIMFPNFSFQMIRKGMGDSFFHLRLPRTKCGEDYN